MDTSELDSAVHHGVLTGIVRRGRAPSVTDLARDLFVDDADVERALERLHDGHGLVLHPGTHEVWAAHPFSLVPTAVWVRAATRGWWAPCIWCALGVAHLTGGRATIHARLAGEDAPVEVDVDGERLSPADLVVHFPVAAARAWDNVHRFCASTLVFAGADDVPRWYERHGVPQGDVQPLERVAALARAWYGPYLDPSWRKWTVAEARELFARLGLRGPTWELPESSGRF